MERMSESIIISRQNPSQIILTQYTFGEAFHSCRQAVVKASMKEIYQAHFC